MKKKKSREMRQRWKKIVQANEQHYIQKKNGKQNQCKTSKQRKRHL